MMNIKRTIQLLVLLSLAAGAVYAFAGDRGSEARAVLGQPAPLFAVAELNGGQLELDSYKGKGVLLNFWASWCTPCVNELPLLNEAYKLTGVEMIAINLGEKPEAIRKFVERYELAFPVGLDPELDLKRIYRAAGLPLTVLIDGEGRLIERHEGELTEIAEIIAMMGRIKQDG